MSDQTVRLYDALSEIHTRPAPFSAYTAADLWDDDHVSARMLAFHLDPDSEPASRPHAFIDRSAAWIAATFDLAAGKRVADFGCGPGLYASRLAAAGARVTGIDFSRRSIAHAREQAARDGLAIDYVLADYLEFETEARFDLITLIYCDLCPLSPEQRGRLLRKFRRLLAPGGRVLLDVSTEAAYAAREEVSVLERRLMDGFWAAGDYWGFMNTFKYDDVRVVLDRYDIIEPQRRRTVYNWLQYFSREKLAAECDEAGLRAVEWYDDVGGAEFTGEAATCAVVLS
jgi:SAM-dependent methyltransferase